MKKITLLTGICSLFFNVSAQDIPNSGFENWKNSGSYEEPLEWGTLNAATSPLGITTAVKATGTDAHSGSFAIKLVSQRIIPLNRNVPGIAVTGTINTTNQTINGGFPCKLRPTSLNGWFKYTPSGVDTASVEISLFKWDATTGTRVLIGYGKFIEKTTVASYTAFKVPVLYLSPLEPDTAVIVLLSSQNSSAAVNSTFFVDDLAFDLPLSVNKTNDPGQYVAVYPNPVTADLMITSPESIGYITIYNLAGSKLSEHFLTGNNNRLSVKGYDNGIYLYRLSDAKHRLIGQGKFIIQK